MNPPSGGKKEWQRFFDAHAAHYEENVFTKNTVAEVDFILSLYPIVPGSTVIDVACGTGRHSIELARRGYRVTGLDLSEWMLDVARSNAKGAGVEVDWIQADATEFSLTDKFDVGLSLCEGGVGLIEKGESAEHHDLAIFKNISAVLKPNAPFILTALNCYSIIRQMKDEMIQDGRFNSATMLANYQDEWSLPEGQKLMTI